MLRKTGIYFGILAAVIYVVFSCKNLGAQDGKKDASQFFPIGLYDVDDPSDFSEIAAAGFNVVQSYKFEGMPPWGNTDAEAIKYLDAAHKAGLKVLVGMAQEAVQIPGSPDKQDLAFIKQRVRAIKDHPALWAYSLFDEPESTGYGRDEPVRPTNFNNAYNAIKQVDTVHPVLTPPNGAIDGTYPYLGVDIMILQYLVLPPGSYPAPWDKLENLREAHRSSFETLASKRKPFILTVQVYNLANDPDMWPGILAYNPEAVGRYPTREEMRFIAYNGIILGAKGILFVSYKTYDDDGETLEDISRQKNPSQWRAVSSVTSELKSISPILLAPTKDPESTGISIAGANLVEIMVKEYRGKTYLFTVNPSEDSVVIRFVLDQDRFPNPTVNLLPEKKNIPLQDGLLVDTWEAYDVHIYEIASEKR